jgi:uncharacterized protein
VTAAEVLKRYKDEELPAFSGIDLTDVNQVGLFGERPLDVASVNATGELGNTALHEAVGQGRVSAVKLLLQFGARRGVRNDAGQTPLDVAHSAAHGELLSLLQPPPVGTN